MFCKPPPGDAEIFSNTKTSLKGEREKEQHTLTDLRRGP